MNTNHNTNIASLILLLTLLNVIDAITTTYLINLAGVGVEANPFMREIIISYGIFGMFAYKSIAIAFLFLVGIWAYTKHIGVKLFHFLVNNELIHIIFLIFTVVITLFTIIHAYKTHCKHIVAFFGITGVLLLGYDVYHHLEPTHPINFDYVASTFHHYRKESKSMHVHNIEIIPIIASIFLILHHITNIQFTKNCNRECCK